MRIAINGDPPEGGITVGSRGGREGSVTIQGLAFEELEYLQGAIEHGSYWVRVESAQECGPNDRRLVAHPVFKEFAAPTDEAMLPFWREFDAKTVEGQLELFVADSLREHASPSITIESLCGYYTPELYAREAKKMERWGFAQMRSPRGTDGRYWEHWLLPYLGMAKGELLAAINGEDEGTVADGLIDPAFEDEPEQRPKTPPAFAARPTAREQLERALRFLQVNASFGSLSISVQKMAMVLDD